jgi:thiamine biosynthesis lipoprotein
MARACLDRGRIDYRRVHLDARDRSFELEEETAIDLGGVAKGWAADALASALRGHGNVLVDLGGDIAAQGSKAWSLGVEGPFRPGRDLAEISLRAGGVATSSSTLKRRWANGHQLIDPRSGRPARTDLAATTAPSATEAEGAAKVALLLSEKPARSFLEQAGWARF